MDESPALAQNNGILQKIVDCVNATTGKIITYNGEPINAFFHSNSGGITETSLNIWGGIDYPYLKSVETSGENGYTQYSSEVIMSKEELENKMKEKYSDFKIDFSDSNCIQILEYTSSNRVKTIKIGNKEIAGTEARTILGLTDVKGRGVVITLTDTDEALYTYIADDLVLLLSELRYAGAEAISINDNRIINLADIVTLNDGLIILYGNVRLTSPDVVKAIGDPTYLMSTLSIKNSGYIDQMQANGMSIEVKQENNIEIGAYTRELNNRYLKEVE